MCRALSLISIATLALTFQAIGCSKSDPIATATDCSDLGEVADSASCDELCAVTNGDFCEGVGISPDCSDLRVGASVDVCGVPVLPPIDGGDLIELARSANVSEFAGSGAPQLGCYAEGGFPSAPGTPEMVTFTGIAKIFSHGCESNSLDINVYTVVRDGSSNDGMPDELVGTTQTGADCTADDAGVPEENEDCVDAKFNGSRWECTYSIANLPTETELLIVTDGDGWAPLYEYNIYAPNGEVVDGTFEKDIRALAQDDYTIIPTTAMGKNMEPGNGAIGGEVHDCDNVRLTNAVVDLDQSRVLTYFTDDETTPLPDIDANATSTLGLYAALDVAPGPVNIAAAGVLDGQVVGVGFFKARVFADSVTSVTFRGLRPFQLP